MNNAAIAYDTWQRAGSADPDVVREAMETDPYGPWRLTRALLPLLRASGRPRIVNVSGEGGSLAGMSGGTLTHQELSGRSSRRKATAPWRRR